MRLSPKHIEAWVEWWGFATYCTPYLQYSVLTYRLQYVSRYGVLYPRTGRGSFFLFFSSFLFLFSFFPSTLRRKR